MTTIPTEARAPLNFVTTRWTQVLSARGSSPEAQTALGELCAAYWTPIFRFLRRSGYDEDAAREQTQAFVAQLLARDGLAAVEPSKGKFRSYLLGAVKHFLSDQRDRVSAVKRGGAQVPLPVEDQTSTSATIEIPDPSGCVPDTFFDRQWAFNVIERALKNLESELATAGKETHYQTLKPWLIGDIGPRSQEAAGQ